MNIGIIGIGCIGSSLARDFKKSHRIFISDKNAEYLRDAENMGLGDGYFTNPTDMVADCDIVFICTHVKAIGGIIKSIAPVMKAGAIITDVGSLKGCIISEVVGNLPGHIHYIPAHPITSGTIEVGPAAGREGVFRGVKYILTPTAHTPEHPINVLSELLNGIGANIMRMDAETHDVLLGFTSHLSHIIAFSELNTAIKLSDRLGVEIAPFAGGSFQDMTRVAASDVSMWRDIFLANKGHLTALCRMLMLDMQELIDMMEREDADGIEAFVNRAHQLKLKMNKDIDFR